MSGFSNYVDRVKQQTTQLRKNLTAASGVDCSKKSIGECATIVEEYIKPENRTDDVYKTPDWYPNIEEIILNAPEITVGSTKYYPSYIVLTNDDEDVTPFYKAHSTTAGTPNYYRSTGGDAVLCGDVCDYDVLKITSDMLSVGTTLQHKWDRTKDIVDPSGNSTYKIRWYIVYVKSTGGYIFDIADFTKLEQVINRNTQGYYYNSASHGCRTLKKLTYSINYNVTSNPSNAVAFANLREVIFRNRNAAKSQKLSATNAVFKYDYIGVADYLPSRAKAYVFNPDITVIQQSGNPGYLTDSKVVFQDHITVIHNISGEANVKEVSLPANLLSLEKAFEYQENIQYVKIPNTLKVWVTTNKTFAKALYVELFEDFDISGVNLSGYLAYSSPYVSPGKTNQWLKDLCKWLKDRTGEDANSMIIGAQNIFKAEKIWLTFNPNNKRDITWVDEDTEGAINVVQFITEQLNWTLS